MKGALLRLRCSLSLLLAAGLAACAPVRLITGDYRETHGPGVILLAGKELRLSDDHTFVYSYWSDDLSSGRYGTGTYQLLGNRLRLEFVGQPPVVVNVLAQSLVPRPDSLILAFAVSGGAAIGTAEVTTLPGASIIAYGEAGQPVAAISSDAKGRAVLRLPRTARAQRLLVQCLGYKPWRQECPASSTAYQLELPPDAGTPYAAGTRKEFRVLRQTAAALVLKQGPVQTTFQRQPAAH